MDHMYSLNLGFLDLSTVDILGWVIPCCRGCPVQYRCFTVSLVLHLFPTHENQKKFPNNAECRQLRTTDLPLMYGAATIVSRIHFPGCPEEVCTGLCCRNHYSITALQRTVHSPLTCSVHSRHLVSSKMSLPC